MIIFDNIDIAWWHYIIAGFCLGTYLHSHLIRHWLHWLVIRVLRGFIWMLQRTDHELAEYLKNPEISVARNK